MLKNIWRNMKLNYLNYRPTLWKKLRRKKKKRNYAQPALPKAKINHGNFDATASIAPNMGTNYEKPNFQIKTKLPT